MKFFIQDIVECLTKVRIPRGDGVWLDLLCLDAHFPHIFSNGPFRDREVCFAQFACVLRSAVNLFGSIISSPDLILHSVFALLRSRGFVTKESMEAGTGNAQSFQHSGDGERAFANGCRLHLGSHFCVDSGC